MTSVRTTRTNSLLFYFFMVPIFLIIALALEELNTCAQTSIGSALSDEISRSVPWAFTIPKRGMPATPTHILSRSVSAVEGFWNFAPGATTVHHQNYYLEPVWYPLQPSGNQATLQLTIQRENAQPTIWLQNLSLLKDLS